MPRNLLLDRSSSVNEFNWTEVGMVPVRALLFNNRVVRLEQLLEICGIGPCSLLPVTNKVTDATLTRYWI